MQLHVPPATETTTKPRAPQSEHNRAVDLDHELTKGFTARMIRQKSKQLAGHFGYTDSDRKDLEQELKLALLERFDQFDPQVGTWEAFATVVVEHHVVTIIEERWAEKREHRHCVISLAKLVKDPDGNLVELATQIGEPHLERVTGVHWPDEVDQFTLEHDLEIFLAKLPPELRDLCERLKRQSIVDIARETGVARSTIYLRIAAIREFFEAEGFRENDPKSPDRSASKSVGRQ